jgi:hypothetical protein
LCPSGKKPENFGRTLDPKTLKQMLLSSSSSPRLKKKKKKKKKKKTCTDRLFPKMGECREVLGGGPAPPSKL